MKKSLLLMTILAGALSFTACSDDDNSSSGGGENSDREFMTMFRKAHNTNSSDDDPYICQVVNGSGLGEKGVADDNAIHYYWYAINGCKGYQIRIGFQATLQGGADAWQSDYENGNLVLDTIVGPDVTDLILPDLQYNTGYYASIRTLSKKDADGDYTHASKWYGQGDGRHWAEYLSITTKERYEVPEVIEQAQITKTSFRVNLLNKVSNFTDADNSVYKQNFSTVTGSDGEEMYKFKYLTVEVPSTSTATLPEKWEKYEITDEDYERGYIEVDGLDQNSVYTVNVLDPDIESEKCFWDAIYNTLSVRTDGDPGDPILIEHSIVEPQRSDFANLEDPDASYEDAMIKYNAQVEYNACRIDTVIANFNEDNSLAEGQVFYLEGGKNYVLFNSTNLCKGFTLATNPDDIAAGKSRAKVFMGGISRSDGAVSTMNFTLGRAGVSGELGLIYVKKVCFENLEFDAPLAGHYGCADGVAGSYFANGVSGAMALTIQSLEIKNCQFERVGVRGFLRNKANNKTTIEKILVEDCDFYNCGFYDANGGGYNWFHEDGGNSKNNIFANFVFQNNTIYDSPHGGFIVATKKGLSYPETTKYNITFQNNTLINFQTRKKGSEIFNIYDLPGGSTITCKNNLFILAAQSGDSRSLKCAGLSITNIATKPYTAIYDFENNWSTNSNLNKGVIFTNNPFSKKSNAGPGNHCSADDNWLISDPADLEVKVADISNEELMYDPNPPYTDSYYIHSTAYIDGSGTVSSENKALGITKGVDIHFKNFDNDIYNNNVGASKWRTK